MHFWLLVKKGDMFCITNDNTCFGNEVKPPIILAEILYYVYHVCETSLLSFYFENEKFCANSNLDWSFFKLYISFLKETIAGPYFLNNFSLFYFVL